MSVAEKKKLGFRDKILKMLDTDSPKDKKKHFFEETSIKFTLRGGSSHSELLVAEAIYHKSISFISFQNNINEISFS